jgi:hypothetical protein
MGSICSNGTEYVDESEEDLQLEDMTPSDQSYQFVFKKDVNRTQ